MKKILFFLVLALVGLKSNGQIGPVFQYDNPPKRTLWALAMEASEKGLAYRNLIVDIVSKGLRDTIPGISDRNITWIFNNLYLEEVYLPDAGFKNSGYDPLKKKMIPSIGHENTMFVWVLRVGTYVLPLIKSDCGNVLEVPVKRIEIKKIVTDVTERPNPVLQKPNTPENDWVPPRTIQEAGTMEIPGNDQPADILIPQQRNKTWFGKNWPWIAGTAATLVTGYLIADHNDWWRANTVSPLGSGVDPPLGDGKK